MKIENLISKKTINISMKLTCTRLTSTWIHWYERKCSNYEKNGSFDILIFFSQHFLGLLFWLTCNNYSHSSCLKYLTSLLFWVKWSWEYANANVRLLYSGRCCEFFINCNFWVKILNVHHFRVGIALPFSETLRNHYHAQSHVFVSLWSSGHNSK